MESTQRKLKLSKCTASKVFNQRSHKYTLATVDDITISCHVRDWLQAKYIKQCNLTSCHCTSPAKLFTNKNRQMMCTYLI